MNGGVGYNWFKLILVDEEKQYAQLEGRLQTKQELVGSIMGMSELVGILQETQTVGKIKEMHLIGTLREQHLIGIMGGEGDD
ncbi:MAG: hypothetical protein J6F30_08760 [Cellulosilyticum sp.]|nr:hypothetical protein [Cellulosilyticum sp.]